MYTHISVAQSFLIVCFIDLNIIKSYSNHEYNHKFKKKFISMMGLKKLGLMSQCFCYIMNYYTLFMSDNHKQETAVHTKIYTFPLLLLFFFHSTKQLVKEFNVETARYHDLVLTLGGSSDSEYLRDELKRTRKNAFDLAKKIMRKLLPHLKE